MDVISPLLWWRWYEDATAGAYQHRQVEFNLPYNGAVLLDRFEFSCYESHAADAIFGGGLSMDPNVDIGALTPPYPEMDPSLIAWLSHLHNFTTSGWSSIRQDMEKRFPEGFVIAQDLQAFYWMTSATNQPMQMRLFYRLVKLTDAEIAGLVVHQRRV